MWPAQVSLCARVLAPAVSWRLRLSAMPVPSVTSVRRAAVTAWSELQPKARADAMPLPSKVPAS
jgi:hypothetical protein